MALDIEELIIFIINIVERIPRIRKIQELVFNSPEITFPKFDISPARDPKLQNNIVPGKIPNNPIE